MDPDNQVRPKTELELAREHAEQLAALMQTAHVARKASWEADKAVQEFASARLFNGTFLVLGGTHVLEVCDGNPRLLELDAGFES